MVRDITGDTATLMPRPSESTTRQLRYFGMDFTCLLHFVIRPLVDASHPPFLAPPAALTNLLALPGHILNLPATRLQIISLVFDLQNLGIRQNLLANLIANPQRVRIFIASDSAGIKFSLTRPYVAGQAVPRISYHHDSTLRATTDFEALCIESRPPHLPLMPPPPPRGVIIDLTVPSFGFQEPIVPVFPMPWNYLPLASVISHDHGNAVVDTTLGHDYIGAKIRNVAAPAPGGIGPMYNEETGLKMTGRQFRQANGSTWIQGREESVFRPSCIQRTRISRSAREYSCSSWRVSTEFLFSFDVYCQGSVSLFFLIVSGTWDAITLTDLIRGLDIQHFSIGSVPRIC
jgi:hypothetical protein